MIAPRYNKCHFLLIFSVWILSAPKVFSAQDDLYDFLWLDPDKKVYVLQNKVYEKKKTFYTSFGLIKGLNTNFQSTTGFHFDTGYYFTEELAIEAVYNKYSNNDDDAYNSIKEVNGQTPYVRRAKSKMGVNMVWSPFYGKINTFNKIVYFDWSFGLGLGRLETESNGETVSNASQADQYQSENHMAVLTKTAFKVHFNKRLHIGLQYSMDHYKSKGPKIGNNPQTESWGTNNEALITIGINF